MSLPLAITAGDPGHIADHETIHDLLRPQAFDSSFAAMGWRRGAIGARPAAGVAGRIYEDVAGPTLAYDDSIGWRELITSHGSHTWTGIQNFDEDAFFGSGNPWFDPKETTFGAVGDGVATDTTALQNCIAAAILIASTANDTGAVVYLSPGSYKSGNLQVTSSTGLTITGPGKLLWSGTAAGNGIGIQMVGTVTGLTIVGIRMDGDAVVANKHQGVWANSGQTLTNIKVINCVITDVITGISMNADTGGSITTFLIAGNRLSNIVGTASGQGYGIHHANGSGNPSWGRIVGNSIDGAQRHSIYQARGSGVTIADNVISNHRSGVATGAFVSALVVSRSQHITVTGNVVATFWDCALEVSPVSPALSQYVTITANVITGAQNAIPSILIGSQDPATEGTPENVTFAGNQVTASGQNIDLVRIYSCKRLLFASNTLSNLATTTATHIVQIRGEDEGAGTATYSDDLVFVGNILYATPAASTCDGWRLDAAFCTSAVNAKFSANYLRGTSAPFATVAAITNTNIIVSDQPYAGLTFAAGVRPFPSRFGSIDARHIGTYTAGDTTPSVANGVTYMRIANASPVTITNFDDGVEGQELTLVFDDANTTVNRANAVLDGGANFVSTQYDTLTLVRGPNYWHEKSRAANS